MRRLLVLIVGLALLGIAYSAGAAQSATSTLTVIRCYRGDGTARSAHLAPAPACPAGDTRTQGTETDITPGATTTTAAVTTTQAPTTTAATTTTASTTTTQPGTTYLFDDEFNGTSLDQTKWLNNWLASPGQITKPVNSEEASCYDPAQISETGGALVLTAAHRNCTDNAGKSYAWASGLITTYGHFRFTTGTLTARVWLSGATKIDDWPALWTAGNPPGSWPASGESDIIEGLSGDACYHYHRSSDPNATLPADGGGNVGCPGLPMTGWHTIAEQVTASTTTYFYDGVNVGSTATVNQPHYIIVNLGVKLGGTDVPAQMLVDYLRVSP